MYSKIEDLIQGLDVIVIAADRKPVLQQLVDYIQAKSDGKQAINLNFICTHNSRRSHLSQIWAQTIAAHFELPNVTCFSGGTEATALFPKVAETLQGQGFLIKKLSEGSNPVYSIKFSEEVHPVIGFSKTYDDDFNPKKNFAALMTCSQADEGCPFIPGADKRVALNYDDPKAFDGTPQQTEKYVERSLQIATELKYVFSKISS
ncbi:MAG: protein-tyrosine-phosphatase [Leeuwenhoekiella sp.]